MSFYKSLKLFRPGKPPIITGPELAQFILTLEQLPCFEDRTGHWLKIKCGKSIDQDDKPAEWMRPTETPFILECAEIEWDFSQHHIPTLQKVRDILKRHRRPIYRAAVKLGPVRHDLFEHLKRDACEDNELALSLDTVSLEIGPVECYDLGSELGYSPGWMEIAISGYGYLFPWTFKDLVQKADSHPTLIRLKTLCQERWPVPPQLLSESQVSMVREIGELWPYPLDQPLDWMWGLAESG